MIQLEERLYTSTEVAEILGVSLRSVYRYLEEDKLKAEVKTATGRHRFTKQNILDFLYPEGKIPEKEVKIELPKKEEKEERVEVATEEAQDDEEQVDWLAKFREAAKKFREESEEATEAVVEEPKVEEIEEPAKTKVEEPEEVEQEVFTGLADIAEKPVEEIKMIYYRSGLGGLKDIAQNIDKSARKSNLDYAFTLSAGLSLYKPIKPFSLLHAYIKPEDQEFFEKSLSLTASEQPNAQICLIISPNGDLYSSKEELHGLFVVSKEKLLEDINSFNDKELLSEAQGVLS